MFTVKLIQRFKSIKYRYCRDLVKTDEKYVFYTSTKCMGNGVDGDGRRVQRDLNESTHSGLEGVIPNPIHILYEKVDWRTTKVTAYKKFFTGIEVTEESDTNTVT